MTDKQIADPVAAMRLMKAAPKLLETLKHVIHHVEDMDLKRIGVQCTLCHSYRMMIHEAIAEAEGKDGL